MKDDMMKMGETSPYAVARTIAFEGRDGAAGDPSLEGVGAAGDPSLEGVGAAGNPSLDGLGAAGDSSLDGVGVAGNPSLDGLGCSVKASPKLSPKEFAGKYGAERIVRLLTLFESYGYVKITGSGAEMLAEARRIMSAPFGGQLDPADRPAALRLREWRLQKASEEKVSAFVIMSNKRLFAIASAHPNTAWELLELGVSRKLVETCLEDILSAARREESSLACRDASSDSRQLEPTPVCRDPSSDSRQLEPTPVCRDPSSDSRQLEPVCVCRDALSDSRRLEPTIVSPDESACVGHREPGVASDNEATLAVA